MNITYFRFELPGRHLLEFLWRHTVATIVKMQLSSVRNNMGNRMKS